MSRNYAAYFQKGRQPVGPSRRHRWRVASPHVDKCDRCWRSFHRIADAPHGPAFCFPTELWMAFHPDDDGSLR